MLDWLVCWSKFYTTTCTCIIQKSSFCIVAGLFFFARAIILTVATDKKAAALLKEKIYAGIQISVMLVVVEELKKLMCHNYKRNLNLVSNTIVIHNCSRKGYLGMRIGVS